MENTEKTTEKELDAAFAELEAYRKNKFGAFMAMVIIGIVLVAGAIIFQIVGAMTDNSSFTLLGFGFLFLCIIFFIIAGMINAKYKKEVRIKIGQAVMDKAFPGYYADYNMMLTLETVMKPGFFAKPDRYNGSDFVQGKYKGIPFKKAVYDLQRRETHTDSKGNTVVTYETYAKGTMFNFKMGRNFHQTVKIMEKTGVLSFGLKGPKGDLSAVETEYIQFNKKFKILTSDETSVFYLLTPQVQEKILELEKSYKGTFYVAYMDDELFVAVNDSGSSANISFFKPVNAENVKNVIAYYGAPALFAEKFELTSDKFKSQTAK